MSQTIADGLQRIIDTKTDIDGAIEAKGGTVTKGLENSDDDIMTIPSSSVTDVQVDASSILDENGVADLVTTGDYEDDDTSLNYNPLATKHYVDDTVGNIPKPMIFKSGATLTADSSDTTKCSIAVVKPDISHGEIIKDGYTYKVTSIAVSPAYTGTIKVGDVLIAAKDSPKLTADWVVDTDWTVVPSGDEEGKIYYAAEGGGLQLTGADNNEFGHSNATITPQATSGIYRVRHDALGHITGSGPVVEATVSTGLLAAAPTSISPANNVKYWDITGETLTLYKLGYGTNNKVVTTEIPLQKLTREVDFVEKTSTIIEGSASEMSTLSNIRRCNVADDGTINAFYGEAGYTEDGTNGQVMVYVPKFWYKTDVSGTGDLEGSIIRHGKWSIANQATDGYKLHPAFIADNGTTERDYFLYGAFEGVGQSSNGTYNTSYNTTDYMLGSVGGNIYVPTQGLTRAVARTMATNRGAGWYLAGIRQTAAIQILMGVELGFNSQAAMGNGVTYVSGGTPRATGVTVGNNSTRPVSNSPVSYRGIENIWCNCLTWLDGVSFQSRDIYISNTLNCEDGTTTGYTALGFSIPNTSSGYYIDAFGYDSNFDWVFFPRTSASSTSSVIGDSFSTYSGICSVTLGGKLNMGNYDYAGAFYWAATTANTTAGGRIMYIPQTV